MRKLPSTLTRVVICALCAAFMLAPSYTPVAAESGDDIVAETQKLLRRGDFIELTRWLSERQAAFEAGRLSEDDANENYTAFGNTDPALRPLFDRWIKAQPKSFVPRLARGIYLFNVGWAERGGAYARATAAAQFRAMAARFREAGGDLYWALAANPKLSMAYWALIDMARATGVDSREIYETGIEEIKGSAWIRKSYGYNFSDRWPTSHVPEWLRWIPQQRVVRMVWNLYERYQFFADIKRDAKKFPELRRLLGYEEEINGEDALVKGRYKAAIAHYDKAIALGTPTYASRGQAHFALRNYKGALSDFEASLKRFPNFAEGLLGFGRTAYWVAVRNENLALLRRALAAWARLYRLDSSDPKHIRLLVGHLGEIGVHNPMLIAEVKRLFPGARWKCPKRFLKPKKLRVVSVGGSTSPNRLNYRCGLLSLLQRGFTYGHRDPALYKKRATILFFGLRQPKLAAKDYAVAAKKRPEAIQLWERFGMALHESGNCRAAFAYRKSMENCAASAKCESWKLGITRRYLLKLENTLKCSKKHPLNDHAQQTEQH